VKLPWRVRRTSHLLARFAAAGALLFALRRAASREDAEAPVVTVTVPACASAAEVAARTEEALLLDAAERAGWARTDAVVRQRLLAALSAAGEGAEEPDRAALRAVSLKLHRKDPVARARLIAAARRAFERAGLDTKVTLDEVSAEIAAHPDRYRRPPQVRFRQVFLSVSRRGAGLEAAAAALRDRLSRPPPPADGELALLGDPWQWGGGSAPARADRLDSLYGEGFGRAVSAAEVGRWTGPVRSSYGLHFVLVEGREEGRLPSPEEARASAEEEILAARRRLHYEERLRELSRRARVVVESAP
jgi:hypothetical protein